MTCKLRHPMGLRHPVLVSHEAQQESHVTYGQGTSRTRHVTYTSEWCRHKQESHIAHERVLSPGCSRQKRGVEAAPHSATAAALYRYIYVWHGSLMCDSFVFAVTHLFVTWLIHMRPVYVCHDSFAPQSATAAELHTCTYMWYGSFMCHSFIFGINHSFVTWLIRICYDSFICDMTHSYVTYSCELWCICATVSHCRSTLCMWHVYMWHALFIWDVTDSHVTHLYVL